MIHDLIAVVLANDIEEVKNLLQQGADPNFSEDKAKITPLHFAAQNNFLEIAILLIAAGAMLDARTVPEGETPLDIAKNQPQETHAEMVALLTFFAGNKSHIMSSII
jgi:ankyrin repeat protein